MAAPMSVDIDAISAPGQRPHVKPISVIEPEKPIRGGCEDSTAIDQRVAARRR